MTTATIPVTTHQGRFGYHPCDFETFLKLKEAHGLLLRAYRDCKRFLRWENKLPDNRNGEEPKCPHFMLTSGYHRLDKHVFYGTGFMDAKVNGTPLNYYLCVLRQYQNARRPKATPEEVIPLELPVDFDAIIAQLKEFYAE